MATNNMRKNHHREFNSLNTEEKIMWRSGQFEIPEGITREEAFSRLMILADRPEVFRSPKTIRLPLNAWKITAAAVAAVLVLITGWYAFNNLTNEEVIAAKGNQTDYQLPDGSMIALNADSKIEFNKLNFNKKRNLQLEGEAFFNVAKGSPFKIATDDAVIEILGTSFNVYARADMFRVSCFSGKIRVTTSSDAVTVMPMETAIITNGRLSVSRDENIHAAAGWRTGEFNFVNSPLNQVFDEIERQFNVTFVRLDTDSLYFTGSINNKNLVNALDIVCITMGLTYEIGSNGRILIKSRTH